MIAGGGYIVDVRETENRRGMYSVDVLQMLNAENSSK